MTDVARSAPTRITDPEAVLILANPLRMRLLGELACRGSARVTDLAHQFDQPANTVNFHLRQLARFGFIEQAPSATGDGMESWWQQTSENGFEIDPDALHGTPDADAAARVLRRVAEGHVLALHRAITRASTSTRTGADDPRPSHHTISDDFALRLSDNELDELREELQALFDRWAERSRATSRLNDGQERHGYYGVVMAALESDMTTIYLAEKGPR